MLPTHFSACSSARVLVDGRTRVKYNDPNQVNKLRERAPTSPEAVLLQTMVQGACLIYERTNG